MAAYEAREVDLVDVVSTQFLSVATQRALRRRLLPVDARPGSRVAYELEPEEPAVLLDLLLPHYVEVRLFAALLEASASEYAARQRAMKAATDNAAELVKTLTREANHARQAQVTTEIIEIVGGAEALRRPTEDGSE